MAPDTTGIVSVPYMTLKILSLDRFIFFCIKAGCAGTFIIHGPGFDLDFCCGLGGVKNLWFKCHSFDDLCQSWLYLVDLLFITPKSIGIFVVAQMALKISTDIRMLGIGALGDYGWAVGTLGHCDILTMIRWRDDIWTLGGWDIGTHLHW